jgi:16S rRNA (cytosine967-C5)-methyltransferase
MAPGVPARRAALDIVTLVRDGAALDEALDACRSFNALEGRDRAFARALASTLLRRQGTIDTLIGRHMDKPLPPRAQKATDILRLAAVQTAVMGVDAHAAVSTAVAIAKSFREAGGYAALINAVARKIAADGVATAAGLPERTDTPGWLWRSWERAYGPAKARAIAGAHRREAPLDVTVKNSAEAETIAAALNARVLPTGSLRRDEAGAVPELPGFADGAWWVQDAAAALPAKLLGDVSGADVLDLCAAPGGKTMQLAAAGGRVTAVDSVGERLKRVQENLSRVRLAAETVKADILDWAPERRWPFILLDAPCTATGTLRRRPDVAFALKESDVAVMARVQGRMLGRASGWLEPGGVLVYATCSLQLEEGEAQIADFLASHAGFERLPVTAAEVGGLAEAITPFGDLRTLPMMMDGGCGGFFAARLRKRI